MNDSLGLRTKQKNERRKRILDAARDLFSERGYSASTIKDIADRAAVSPPTVHKYYGTKQQLLFDLLIDSDDMELSNGSLHLDSIIPVEAMAELLTSFVDRALLRVDKGTWAYAFEAFEDQQNNDARRGFNAQLSLKYDQLEKLFRELKMRGALAADFDISSTREIFEMINQFLFKAVLFGEIAPSQYHAKILSYAHCILTCQTQDISTVNH